MVKKLISLYQKESEKWVVYNLNNSKHRNVDMAKFGSRFIDPYFPPEDYSLYSTGSPSAKAAPTAGTYRLSCVARATGAFLI